MADIPVPSIATATPDGDDTVLGVKDGLVKRFTLDNVGAGINFSAINATTNMVLNTNGTEKMRIDSSGNVGIGTSSPSAKLDVNGSKDATNLIIGASLSTVGGGAFANYSELLFKNTASSNSDASIRAYGNAWDSVGSELTFLTANNSAVTERMRIDSSGNLIQTVNTTAATLGTNNTLTFSIVDNSTLRISVRGSDGTTRTAIVTLT